MLANAMGCPDPAAALKRLTTAKNVGKVAGDSWLRGLADAKA